MSVKGFTDIGLGHKVLTLDHDPRVVATDAPKGSLLVDADGCQYRKCDDGETTNVVDVGLYDSHETVIHPSDDMKAILEAAADGDSFFLAPGLHTITDKVTIANKKDISIHGTSAARVTRSGSPQIFQILGCEDLHMEGFTITVVAASLSVLQINNAGAAPYQYPTRHSYEGLHFEITSGVGGVDNCITCVDSFLYGVIRDCAMDGAIEAAINIYAGAGESAEGTIITNNRISTTVGGGTGINVSNQGDAGMFVEGNQIDGAFATGINVAQLSPSMSLRGNIIRGTTGTGIYTGTVTDRSIISHNIIWSPGGRGIWIYGSKGRLSGNIVYDATLAGIQVNGDINNISGNTVTDGATSALYFPSGANYNVAGENTFSGNATGPIINDGANNTIDGKIENTLSTTDDTATTISTIAIPDDCAAIVEVAVEAFQTNGAGQAMYREASGVYRRSAGNVAIQGSESLMTPIESDAAWAVTFVVSGTNLLVRVLGANSKDINWKCRHTVEVAS